MKYVFTFCILLFSVFCFAQGVSTAPQGGGINNGLISSNNRYGSKIAKHQISYEEAIAEYEGIDGSPFLYGGGIMVDFIFKDDSIIKDININYDLYNKEIIVNKKEGGVLILDQDYYKGFIYINEKEEKELYYRLQAKDPNYYQILYKEGDFIFCKNIKTTVLEVKRHVPGQEILPAKFSHKPEYFIMRRSSLIKVGLNNEEVLDYLPSKYKKQVAGLKSQLKIRKLRKEKDYIRLMKAFEVVDEG